MPTVARSVDCWRASELGCCASSLDWRGPIYACMCACLLCTCVCLSARLLVSHLRADAPRVARPPLPLSSSPPFPRHFPAISPPLGDLVMRAAPSISTQPEHDSQKKTPLLPLCFRIPHLLPSPSSPPCGDAKARVIGRGDDRPDRQ